MTRWTDLERTDDFDSVRFSAVCAVGRGVRMHLPQLMQATHRKTKPSWAQIIEDLDHELSRPTGASLDPKQYVAFAKEGLRSLMKSWAKQNPALRTALGEIVNQVKVFQPGELRKHIQDLHDQGIRLGKRCVSEWGGRRAKQLVDVVPNAEMRFARSDTVNAMTTYCDKHRAPISVTLVLGKGDRLFQNLLKSYLSLEFYFFHEFLSHQFPLWDDPSGSFSEGYLFALEKSFFQAKCHELVGGFALHPFLVNENIADHRAKSNEGSRDSDYYQQFEGLYAWLSGNCSDRTFAGLLLELAATRPANQGRRQFNFFEILETAATHNRSDVPNRLSAAGVDFDLAYQILLQELPPFPPSLSRSRKVAA